MNTNRGSEWRRWELHLHTPNTNKNDNYEGKNSEEKWNNFYRTIEEYIGDGTDPLKTICSVAITDYLSIDNYIKVCNDNRLPDSIQLILPNVELRLSLMAGNKPINIHCIFDPSIVGELEDRFFNNLTFYCNDKPYKANKKSIINLGRDFNNDQNLPEEKAFLDGIQQFIISQDTLLNLFKKEKHLRDKTIIVVSNKSTDGVSGLTKHKSYIKNGINQLEATRRNVYQLADMIFSSNDKDIKYFLGEGPDSVDTIIEKFGSLKPCIHGCDAHTNKKIFSPDEDRFCWIKAEPTFEGLKQVLYEPKERVRICNTIPEEKHPYNVIDRIEIINNNDFSSEPIYFSDKLTCIIGGKSTGKSLLINSIANAIDTEQAKEKRQLTSTNTKNIDGLKVYWRDGICSSDREIPRKIVYIPQTYLNRLSDNKEETTEIDLIIKDIILQNTVCSKAYEIMQDKINIKKQQIAKRIIDFLTTIKEKNRLIELCKDIGEEDTLNTEINRLTKQFNELSEQYSISDSDIKEYQNAVEQEKSLSIKRTAISNEIAYIEKLVTIIDVKTIPNNMVHVYQQKISDVIDEIKKYIDNMWHSKQKEILEYANNDKLQIEVSIQKCSDTIKKLHPQIENNYRISQLSKSIVEEREKLYLLSAYKKQLENIQEQYTAHLEYLTHVFDEFGSIYMDYINTVKANFTSCTNELEFSLKNIFRTEKFCQKIKNIIDNRTINKFEAFDLQNVSEDQLKPENIKILIEDILNKSHESIQLKNGYTPEDAFREILTDWYNICYIVTMDNDNIQEMSPGKKALVLLKLLIILADNKHPILIDQPEDDLDNRSIFNELAHFIKQKKIDRQIITVTHNANIVLGSDAELVIVANQNGKNTPNKKFRFEYKGGAIEDNLHNKCNEKDSGVLNSKSIQEHICEILEGGRQAFALRQHKYNLNKK